MMTSMDDMETTQDTQGKIAISSWSGLLELRDLGDDWTGVTSWQERRKRQNRLSQRALRRRRKENYKGPSSHRVAQETIVCDIKPEHVSRPEGDFSQSGALVTHGYQLLRHPGHCERARQWQAQVYQDYMLKRPNPTSLQALIRINALNAIARNAIMIGIQPQALCRDEAISPFGLSGTQPSAPTEPLPACPDLLHPTPLQMRTPHHPWIDLLPLPRLRDNLLMALSIEGFDEDELCVEVFHPYDQCESEEKPALIVWGESGDIRGWEVNVAFLKKWGWLLRGCNELLQSTNAWRMQRGEKTLNFDL